MGRAGQVRLGTCWHLYDETFHQTRTPLHPIPKYQWTLLEEYVLFFMESWDSERTNNNNQPTSASLQDGATLLSTLRQTDSNPVCPFGTEKTDSPWRAAPGALAQLPVWKVPDHHHADWSSAHLTTR